MPRLRIVLDTNVLVSGLAYPESIPGRIVTLWRHGGVDVSLSRYILNETTRVLPRLSRITLTPEEILDMVDGLMFLADIAEPAVVSGAMPRDAKDEAVLGTLVAAKADYLITGDKDLLALSEHYPILTPAAFWARHG
jgi:putative PIN family toxin of toxin-antitoxin system